MKKKSPKKLELSKETLKKLESDKLQEVHGGLMDSHELKCQ